MKYLKYFEAKRVILSKKYPNMDYRLIDLDKQEPLKDTDTLRVYHGFYSYNDVKEILKSGLSGKQKARRVYSYEAGNNPKGLFITADFNVAKRNFASSGVIIEFTCKVSDLEAPVWAGGRYFHQGEYAKSFTDWDWSKMTSKQREEELLRRRELAGKSEYEFIRNSDRPELAESLYNSSEYQALFIGDLDPNMIKYIWYKDKNNSMYSDSWQKYTRKDFINKFKIDTNIGNYIVYYPKDDFNIDDFKRRVEEKETEEQKRKHKGELFQNYLKYYLDDDHCNEYELKEFGFFPKQIQEIIRLRKEGAFKPYRTK
jgi:hypothetical protein